MSLVYAMTIAVLLAGGMGVALLGSVKVALARKLRMDEARVGGLVSMFAVAMIPVILSVGFLTDLVGKQPVVIGGCLLMSASLIVLGAAGRYPSALVAVLLFSASWSALINVINPVAAIVFGGSKTYAMNLACFYFGLGAFGTPLAVRFLLRRAGLTKALLLLAGLVLVPAVLGAWADFSALLPAAREQAATEAAPPGLASLLRDPVMWLCTLAFLFYGPLEAATGAWTTTYLGDKGLSEGGASVLLSAFWLTYTASRLLTALGAEAFGLPARGERALILAFGLAAVAALSGIVWGRGRAMAVAMVIAAGLVFGPIFPTIMAVLLGHFDPSVHGRAVGVLFAVGGIGTATIPAAMGAYAKRTSVQRGFLIAVCSAAALTLVAFVLVLGG
jgi:MFS family permease